MKLLLIDIGAGTMDILWYDLKENIHYKIVSPSPVLTISDKIKNSQKDLLITGVEMGGGAVTHALIEKVRQGREIIISKSASKTVHHDPDRVKGRGLIVIDDSKAEDLIGSQRYQHIEFKDIDHEGIKALLRYMGIPLPPEIVGICAQDHGIPKDGMSHLEFRNHVFKRALSDSPYPHSLLYERSEIPPFLSRLKSISLCAEHFGAEEIYVMDSGMAAIMGACVDPEAYIKRRRLIMDVATSHTLCATLDGDELMGFFEYHTVDITTAKIETLVHRLLDGTLSHREVLSEGGHGAWVRKGIGIDNPEIMLLTGPKRQILKESSLSFKYGAPLGDNMMTGTVGLLESIRRKKGLDPIPLI